MKTSKVAMHQRKGCRPPHKSVLHHRDADLPKSSQPGSAKRSYLFPVPAIGRLEERNGSGIFEACLQAQRGGSGECIPYGRRAVAPRNISMLKFANFTKINWNLVRSSPHHFFFFWVFESTQLARQQQ